MSLDKIERMLHPFERKVLPLLSQLSTLSKLTQKSGLQEVEVMRALEWLENKELVTIKKVAQRLVVLGKNGEKYAQSGLPEYKILSALQKKSLSFSNILSHASIDKEELNASLGVLRKNGAISIKKDKEVIVSINSPGKTFLKEKKRVEKFLHQKFPLDKESLSKNQLSLLNQFLQRKEIVTIEEIKDRVVTLTATGKKLLKKGISTKETIGRVTPQLLKTSGWEGKEFRPYDVTINVPSMYIGKKHIVTQAVDYIKQIWLELGFKEMNGRMVETTFWDLDSLFVPQDHPAREMQDTFYVEGRGNLPALSKTIQKVHETGGKTKSKGWGGKWSSDEAKRLLLRTHTTVLSAQTLARLKESDLPAKFFSVGKVFRNEALDSTHLFEFYQVEGIVVDPNANFKHLKGYLKEFYKKMGYSDVRIRPAHFPYTEPSCEVEAFHPVKKKWIELGGAGIFRPEVVIPLLGKDVPVLAWGLGLGRIISSYYNITDIRNLYKNDLKMLREAKLWVR